MGAFGGVEAGVAMSCPVRDPASGAPTLGCGVVGLDEPSSDTRLAGDGGAVPGVTAGAGRGRDEGGTAAALGGATVGAAGDADVGVAVAEGGVTGGDVLGCTCCTCCAGGDVEDVEGGVVDGKGAGDGAGVTGLRAASGGVMEEGVAAGVGSAGFVAAGATGAGDGAGVTVGIGVGAGAGLGARVGNGVGAARAGAVGGVTVVNRSVGARGTRRTVAGVSLNVGFGGSGN